MPNVVAVKVDVGGSNAAPNLHGKSIAILQDLNAKSLPAATIVNPLGLQFASANGLAKIEEMIVLLYTSRTYQQQIDVNAANVWQNTSKSQVQRSSAGDSSRPAGNFRDSKT